MLRKNKNLKLINLASCLSLILLAGMFTSCTDGTSTSQATQPGVLENIEITTIPTTTTYYEGDLFSNHGMVVTAYYDNDFSQEVTDYTWSPSGPLTAEDTIVTISYTENEVTKTAEQEINIKAAPAKVVGIDIVTPPDKTVYTAGETFDKTGMKVVTVLDKDTVEGEDITNSISYSPSGALTTDDTEITISYKLGDDVFEDTLPITVNEGTAIITSGAVTYSGMHQIVIDPELVGEEGEGYTLSGGMTTKTWDYNGTYKDSPFGRMQADGAGKYVTFEYDFSSLDDVSKVGFSANMIGTRARTLIEVSTDNQDFVTIGYSDDPSRGGNNYYCSDYHSDYKQHVTSLRGFEVGDPNLYNYFWSLGEYIGESKKIYVRFGYTDEYQNDLESQAVGADVIDNICFYDSLEIAEIDRIEITKMPDKTSYFVGEKFDSDGMEVTAYFKGMDEGLVINDYTISPLTITSETTEITITYRVSGVTKTTTLPITVSEAIIKEGAHDIMLETDTDKYVMNGSLKDWSNNGFTFKRFRCDSASENITFTLDYSKLEDKSAIGVGINLIASRQKAVIEVSTDGSDWVELGHTVKVTDGSREDDGRDATMICDYSEKVTSLYGSTVSDKNLICCYYNLSEYLSAENEDGIIYIRGGFNANYSEGGNGNVGADIIAGITYYDKLQIADNL